MINEAYKMAWSRADSYQGGKLHFSMYSVDAIPIGTDPNNPTYITGAVMIGSSSSQFTLLDAATGLVRNDSGRTISMIGTASYQMDNGTGGTAQLNLWSERSDDDGLTFVENTRTLRDSEASNTSASSQTKAAGAELWKHGESIRFAMFNGAGGTLTFSPPTALVNGGNTVEGFSFLLMLSEV